MGATVSVALFLRHGRASAFGEDYDQLSSVGVEQSELFGEWLAEAAMRIDHVFVGPRKRHAQTLDAIVRALSARTAALPAAAALRTPEVLPAADVLPDLDEHDGISLVF